MFLYLSSIFYLVFISTSFGAEIKCNSGLDERIQYCHVFQRMLGILPPALLSATTIYFNRNAIRDIDAKEFNKLTKIQQLYLHENHLTTLSPEWFAKMPDLISIDLSGNLIKEVGPKVFQNCLKLQHVNLSKNEIRRFYDISDIFHRASIDLSENPLVDLSIGKVHTLYVNHTALEQLNLEKSFVNLYASHSRINRFSFGFSDSHRLETLDLRDNNLTDISNITTLRGGPLYLDLSQNYFGTLSPETFLNLERLRHLNLSKTIMLNLYYGMFWNQKDLRVLDMSSNHLWSLNTNKLYPVMLDELYVQNNTIIHVWDERNMLRTLKKLGLAGNSLDCEVLLDIYMNVTDTGVEFYTPPEFINREGNNVAGIACN